MNNNSHSTTLLELDLEHNVTYDIFTIYNIVNVDSSGDLFEIRTFLDNIYGQYFFLIDINGMEQ